MKYNGLKIEKPNELLVVIPRGEMLIPFRAKAVLDYADFYARCPAPKPPMGAKPGEEPQPLLDHPQYKEALQKSSLRMYYYMILKSLEDPSLTWETIKMDDPDTWQNFEKEMIDSKFTSAEIRKIVEAVLSVNSLNEKHLDEARTRFLASTKALAA